MPEEINEYNIGGDPNTDNDTDCGGEGAIEPEANAVDLTSGQKKYEPEVPVAFLKHPETGKIFPANKDIIKQKHLMPCDEKGKVVSDTRRRDRII